MMTAVNIVAQPRHGLVHIATDAALYTRGQQVVAFRNKTVPIPNWPGAITNLGNAGATILLAAALSEEFQTFDEVVSCPTTRLKEIVIGCGLPTGADVIVAGISAERGPESWLFRTNDELPPGLTAEEAAASPCWPDDVGQLVRLPDCCMSPVGGIEDAIAANFEGIDVDANPEAVVWSIRKHLEIQRHVRLPDDMGGIGGFAVLTTVSAQSVTQSVLTRWSEDRIGAPLKAAAIDWKKWHADNPKPAPRKLGVIARQHRREL